MVQLAPPEVMSCDSSGRYSDGLEGDVASTRREAENPGNTGKWDFPVTHPRSFQW